MQSFISCMTNRRTARLLVLLALGVCAPLSTTMVSAHGNVTPQTIKTDELPQLTGPLTENPYRGTAAFNKAVEIGTTAFSENCARCHGLGAVSGGIAPDLRSLSVDTEGDDFFQMRVRGGSIRNGITYMPPFKDILGEEAIWAIRSWLETVRIED